MQNFQYTVESHRSFEEAVRTVEQSTAQKGFRVLHTHDVAATLAEKGFHRDPLKIVEVCNARYAHEVLQKDLSIALMLPCPITVYVQNDKTYVSTMRPSVLAEFYPKADVGDIAAKVEQAVLEIVNEAK